MVDDGVSYLRLAATSNNASQITAVLLPEDLRIVTTLGAFPPEAENKHHRLKMGPDLQRG